MSGVWSDCVPVVGVLCAHACVCVIILTALVLAMCKVSTIITPYMQCVLHTWFCIFSLYGQYMPCQNHGV